MEWNLLLSSSGKGGGASPRCFAVVPRTTTLEARSHITAPGNVVSVAFGTDRGSFHARTYSLPSTAPMLSSSSNTSSKQMPITAQGGGSSRAFLPLDIGALPGPVVNCIPLLLRRGGMSAPRARKASTNPLWLLWILDDTSAKDRSTSYATIVVSTGATGFQILRPPPTAAGWPRMSCAAFYASSSDVRGDCLVYAVGRSIHTLTPEAWGEEPSLSSSSSSSHHGSNLQFPSLPPPGVRSGAEALLVLGERPSDGGLVVLVAVGHTVHVVVGVRQGDSLSSSVESSSSIRSVLSFSSQSSLVHPVILLDLQQEAPKMEHDRFSSSTVSIDRPWRTVFLASGRECAVVDLEAQHAAAPRNGIVTVNSPILSATACAPYLVLLQSDGLISLRAASCLAISLRTIEVGQRPNDYFVVRTLPTTMHNSGAMTTTTVRNTPVDGAVSAAVWSTAALSSSSAAQFPPSIVAVAYSGECKVLPCLPDTAQELADRLLRLAADAGFPYRTELMDSLGTASSYAYAAATNEPSTASAARLLLKQYLEAGLGLTDWGDDGGSLARNDPTRMILDTAVLCWVATQLVPPLPAVAQRAAQACAQRRGLVLYQEERDAKYTTLCGRVAEQLLREASLQFSLGSSAARKSTELVEAAIWLFRLAGQHARAMDVAAERLQPGATTEGGGVRGFWSPIKYESYTATHLSELWSAGNEEAQRLVLSSPATKRLLERNPRLGLSVFTARHPQNEAQWKLLREDPLGNPALVQEVLALLKSIHPVVAPTTDPERPSAADGDQTLPLESGRALAVSFLRSAMGITTGRSMIVEAREPEPFLANIHDELALLLLEGIILERSEGDEVLPSTEDSALGRVYRTLLREYLQWPLAQLRPEPFLESLPPTFLHEKALVLGRLGHHEEALRIFYGELNSLDLALAYCDHRYVRQKQKHELYRKGSAGSQVPLFSSSSEFDPALDDFAVPKGEDNAYLPLVRVALESPDKTRGTQTAIQVLALRRGAIDRPAALRLLPTDVPVSAVARPFLIPALVDSASQVRRMTVVSALMRARYGRLKDELLTAQLKAQEKIQVVPALQSLQLGEAMHSTKSTRARTVNAAPDPTMPYVEIVKYFFPRHLVIQAKVTNTSYSSTAINTLNDKASRPTLSDITFVVAESSEDEALVPLLQVAIQCLPPQRTGSAWFVLSAAPSLMEAPTALLTCELRYSVGGPGGSNDSAVALTGASVTARSFVEELQDIEIHAAHFFPKMH